MDRLLKYTFEKKNMRTIQRKAILSILLSFSFSFSFTLSAPISNTNANTDTLFSVASAESLSEYDEGSGSKTKIGEISINTEGNMERVEGYRKRMEEEQKLIHDTDVHVEPEEEKNKVGRIRISEDEDNMLSQYQRNKNRDAIISSTPSETAKQIQERLENISEMTGKNDFKTALAEMKKLSLEYPEFLLFRKWIAVYQNRLGQFKESLETIHSIHYDYPFSPIYRDSSPSGKEKKDVDLQKTELMLLYYEIDDYRRLKQYKDFESSMEKFKTLISSIQMENKKLLEEVDDKGNTETIEKKVQTILPTDLYEILYDYQSLMKGYDTTKEIKQNDLYTLWKKIPKGKSYQLNKFYGYNLDDLGYLFGKRFNRKDVLVRYVKNENWSDEKDTIKKVQDAKSILLQSYQEQESTDNH